MAVNTAESVPSRGIATLASPAHRRRVIGLSVHEDNAQAAAIRVAGAVGYVTKTAPAEILLAAIRACVRSGA